MQRELRRLQTELSISGRGVIVLGAWDFVKVFLYILFASNYIYNLFGISDTPELYTIYIIVWAILVFISFLIRFYIGRRAILEARADRGHKKLYLILSGFMCLNNVSNIAGLFISPSGFDDVFSVASTLLLETASAVNLLFLIRAVLKLRKIRSGHPQEAECNAA